VAGRQAQELLGVVHHGWDSLHARFRDPRLLHQWREWARSTIARSRREADTVIVVDKLRRRLDLYHHGVRVASFAAELGANGLRPKNHAGDQATPEGLYKVVDLKEGPRTKYYKALLIDYPNGEDVVRFRRARQRGTIPSRVAIGGLIEIHGAGGEGRDWTDGCVALTNADMEDLYRRVREGTPVTIVGTL
jgi:murein L,D-transpeptidase YafK